MQVIALILGCGAAIVFFVEAWLTRSLVALGLGVLTVAWLVELCVTTGTRVTLG